MVLRLHQYNSLQLIQKAVLLGDASVFLMTLEEDDDIYSLYAYGGFYVEVVIRRDSGKLMDIVAFDLPDKLDKYLDRIVLIGF